MASEVSAHGQLAPRQEHRGGMGRAAHFCRQGNREGKKTQIGGKEPEGSIHPSRCHPAVTTSKQTIRPNTTFSHELISGRIG